jgi:hypothetical protein
MRTLASKRRSSFGTRCVQCGNYLVAPDRSEYRDEWQIHHLWHCSKCDRSFVVILPADTKSIKVIMTRIGAVMAERHRAAAACRESSSGGTALPTPRHTVTLPASIFAGTRACLPRRTARVRHSGPL